MPTFSQTLEEQIRFNTEVLRFFFNESADLKWEIVPSGKLADDVARQIIKE